MKVFEKLVLPNGSQIQNRIAKAAMEENMADLNHAPSEELMHLYQSDHWWAGSIRDLTFPWMYQIPYFRKEMAMTISGLKTGMFEQMSYQQVAQYTECDNTFSTKSESLPEYE